MKENRDTNKLLLLIIITIMLCIFILKHIDHLPVNSELDRQNTVTQSIFSPLAADTDLYNIANREERS